MSYSDGLIVNFQLIITLYNVHIHVGRKYMLRLTAIVSGLRIMLRLADYSHLSHLFWLISKFRTLFTKN